MVTSTQQLLFLKHHSLIRPWLCLQPGGQLQGSVMHHEESAAWVHPVHLLRCTHFIAVRVGGPCACQHACSLRLHAHSCLYSRWGIAGVATDSLPDCVITDCRRRAAPTRACFCSIRPCSRRAASTALLPWHTLAQLAMTSRPWPG